MESNIPIELELRVESFNLEEIRDKEELEYKKKVLLKSENRKRTKLLYMESMTLTMGWDLRLISAPL